MGNMWACTYVHSPWWDPQQSSLYPQLSPGSETEKNINKQVLQHQGSWADMRCQKWHARWELAIHYSLLAPKRNSSWRMHLRALMGSWVTSSKANNMTEGILQHCQQPTKIDRLLTEPTQLTTMESHWLTSPDMFIAPGSVRLNALASLG